MASGEKRLVTDDVRLHQGSKLANKEGTLKACGSDSEFKRKKMIKGDELDGERGSSKKLKVSDGDKKDSGEGRISLAESSENHKDSSAKTDRVSNKIERNKGKVSSRDNKDDLGKGRLSSGGEKRRSSSAGAGLSGKKVMSKRIGGGCEGQGRKYSDCVDEDGKTNSSAKVRVSSGEKQQNQKKMIGGTFEIEAQGKNDKGKLVLHGDNKDSSRVRLSSGGLMDKSGQTRTKPGVENPKFENVRDNSGRKPVNSGKSDALRKQRDRKSVPKNKADTSQVWKWWIIYFYVATWLLMEFIHWELGSLDSSTELETLLMCEHTKWKNRTANLF